MSPRPILWTILAMCLGGCSAIVDFDRSRLVDAGTDAGADAGVTDEEQDAAVEAARPDQPN
jgi:hypothetical protein